jgi:hypothetical protein
LFVLFKLGLFRPEFVGMSFTKYYLIYWFIFDIM